MSLDRSSMRTSHPQNRTNVSRTVLWGISTLGVLAAALTTLRIDGIDLRNECFHTPNPFCSDVSDHVQFLFNFVLAASTPGIGAVFELIVVAVTIGAAFAALRSRKEKLFSQRFLNQMRDVGTHAERLRAGDGQARSDAATALIGLLPSLSKDDYYLLTNRQRGSLYRALNHLDSELVCAILQTLERVSDTKAAPYVRRIIKRTATMPSDRRVKKAASQYLRSLSTDVTGPLVRPAKQPEYPAQHLLRPAFGSTSTDSKRLLRVGSWVQSDL